MRKYIPEFDSLRAIAVLAVMVYHAAKNFPQLHFLTIFRHGYLGVDLFFVLSGFLITGILLRTRSEAHYFRNFYGRRALRIWPLYFIILLLTFVVLPSVHPAYKTTIAENCHPAWPYLLFVQNFWASQGIGPVTVTWSLAIEEQFYLLWPLLVFLLSRKTLITVCLCVIAFTPVLRWFMLGHGFAVDYLYRLTPTRLDGLAAGCLLAIVTFRMCHALAMAVIGGVGLILSLYLGWTPLTASAAAIAFSGIALFAIHQRFIPMWKPLRYLGKISYGLYLLHVPVFDVVRELIHPHGILQSIAILLFDLCLCVAITSLSWKFLEAPILTFKQHFELGQTLTPETPSVDLGDIGVAF